MLSLSPNCLLIAAPLSPSKLRPLAIVVLIVEIAFLLVAISCVFWVIFCLFCAISVLFLPISVVFWAISVLFLVISCLFLPISVAFWAMSVVFWAILSLFVLTCVLTVFNWSSVAARPVTACGLFTFQAALVSPVTVPAVPSTVTGCAVPTASLLPNPTVYSLPPFTLVPSVTVTFASFDFTVVAFAVPPIALCNWLKLTASLGAVPLATPVIFWLLALMPSGVT